MSTKAIATVTTALFFASLLWLMNTKHINSSLEAGLKDEKLKSEELLSERLLLEKDFEKIKHQLFALQDKNLALNNVVKDSKSRLEIQEGEYNRMKKENRSLAQLKTQRKELIEIQSRLENDIQSIKSVYAELEEKNSELMNTVAFLQERNLLLTNDLNKAMLAAVDQSQIQAVKGKREKLTIHANRTKKLIADFEVAADLKNLTFRIIDPKGMMLSQKDGSIVFTSSPSEKSFTASSDPEILGSKLQKVEMIFIPNEKLKTGVYMVQVLNANLYVGSLKVKLN